MRSGSIFVRNSTQFDGYTSGTTKDFHDGFMSSGDVGYLDDAGRLFVVGRDDEMIVSGGENVYPIEVEKTLTAHPDVAGGRACSASTTSSTVSGWRPSWCSTDGADATAEDLKAARPGEPGQLQGAARDHHPRRAAARQHWQDSA